MTSFTSTSGSAFSGSSNEAMVEYARAFQLESQGDLHAAFAQQDADSTMHHGGRRREHRRHHHHHRQHHQRHEQQGTEGGGQDAEMSAPIAEEEETAEAPIHERYDFADALGEGSFAVVKRGIERNSGHEVAIKVMTKERMPPDSELLRRELEAGRKLHHAHLSHLLEYTEDATNLYMVFDLIPGTDLLEFVGSGATFSQEHAQMVSWQLLQALHYCHQNFVAHRDIKLENVMVQLGATPSAVLLDFGLCFPHTSQEDRYSSEHCGSADYCGPEILLRADLYDTHASDVWALGVVMFILVYGTLPFNRERRNHMIIFQQVHPDPCFPEPTDPPTVAPVTRDVLLQMLVLQPDQRLTTAGMLEHGYFSGSPPSANKTPHGLRGKLSSFLHTLHS